MGGRAGGGASGGMGKGSRSYENITISGRGRYGDNFSRTLGDELAQYKQEYAKLEKELGDAYRKQAAAASTEMLKKYVSNRPQGEAVVKSEWKANVKLAKSGKYDLEIVSHAHDDWGRSVMKAIAKGALQQNIIKGELAKRK